MIEKRKRTQAPFTCWTNFSTGKNLHGSTLRLHGNGETGRIFERLGVQVWKFGTWKKQINFLTDKVPYFVWTRVNTRTVQLSVQTRAEPAVRAAAKT